MTAVTRCQTGSQTCTPPFFSTLKVMLANLFCLSSVSSQRPEITLHRYLWKILFIKSWRQMRMKAKAWRQSFTCTVISGTSKASANIYTLLAPITWVDTSPGKEPQPACSLVLPLEPSLPRQLAYRSPLYSSFTLAHRIQRGEQISK